MVALVDDEDFAWASEYSWHAQPTGNTAYARRGVWPKGKFMMHRELMAPAPGLVIDHINGNGLDNRRCNLRVCTRAQNSQNSPGRLKTSAFKGVHQNSNTWGWLASITADGQSYPLGTFDTQELAARAYDAAAAMLHGQFAKLNFPHRPAADLVADRALFIGSRLDRRPEWKRRCVRRPPPLGA